MKVVVLKAFPYAHNGIDTADQAVGVEIDVRDELVPGLKAAGYLGDVTPQKSLPGFPLAGVERGPQNNAALGSASDNAAVVSTEQPAALAEEVGSAAAEHATEPLATDTVPHRRRRRHS